MYKKHNNETYDNNRRVFHFITLPQIPIEQNRCAMACQGCGAVFTSLQNKRSGNQVLKVVLLNHHKITIKQDRHCHHYENNTIYRLVFQALLL